jgi:hypothetical protein
LFVNYFDKLKQMKTFYELSGLLAFVIAWFGMLLAVFSQGNDKRKSISLHAASSKKTILLLAILSPISMSLFIVFSVRLMAPALHLPLVFIVMSILADLGYIFAAWIPSTGGVKTKLHDTFSYGASLLLIPITFILVISPNAATLAKVISSTSLMAMLGILATMFRNKRALPHYLYYQIAYFLAFDISLLVTGYIN